MQASTFVPSFVTAILATLIVIFLTSSDLRDKKSQKRCSRILVFVVRYAVGTHESS